MERDIVYILAVLNLTIAFHLIYFNRSPFSGRKKKNKECEDNDAKLSYSLFDIQGAACYKRPFYIVGQINRPFYECRRLAL